MATFSEVERDGWADAAVAAAYARDFAAAADEAVPALIDGAGAAPGRRILDLCSGHGNVALGLCAAGAEVTGLDFSPAMLALARRNCPGARFVEGDAGDLPFGAGDFDGVTIGFGMPHVPDPRRVLDEVRRVLSPGGRLAYSVWQGPEVEGAFGWVFRAIADHGDPAVTLPPGPGANDYADPEIAFPALAAAGFADPEIAWVDSGWTSGNAAAPFDFFAEGTVRGGVLLRNQPPAHKARIRAAVAGEVLRHLGRDGPWRIPIPSVVVSATAV